MNDRAVLASWRDAIRDSDLPTVTKAVAYTVSTYWDRNGRGAYPSRATIAAGASLKSVRAVDSAIRRLETGGFLIVARSKGRTSSRYSATLPTAHGDALLGDANGASDDNQQRTQNASTVHGGAPESAESVKTNASTRAGARGKKRAADARDYSEYNRG